MSQRTAELLLNMGARSGAGRVQAEEIVQRLSRCGMRVTSTTIDSGSGLEAAARSAVRSRPDVVITGGGDGTLSTVAGILAGTPISLGVLPLGTFNHFATDLGIPLDLGAAIETICLGQPTQVDVGRVNGRVFINNSSLGYYPNVLHKREELRDRFGHDKWTAFIRAMTFVFRRFPLLDVRIKVDGQDLVRRTPLLLVGNNRYDLSATRFGMRKRLDAGQLSVYIINRTDRVGLLVLAAHAAFGRLPKRIDFETLSATHLEVNTRRGRVAVATDGELTSLSTPLIYDIEPRALWVLVPPTKPVSSA